MTYLKIIVTLTTLVFLASCGDNSENWSCQTSGKSMYSISTSGELGSADKGCSCNQIRAFELEQFGEVDEVALKADFRC